jgi:predicted metalloenzyme YecM
MIKDLDDFYKQAQAIIPAFDGFISQYELKNDVKADHINYKCGSRESFEALRGLFETDSRFMYQSMIAGRIIALIGLKNGLENAAGTIYLLELSDQKPDGSQTDGFDHVEIYPVVQAYADFVKSLERKFFDKGLDTRGKTLQIEEVVRPHHTSHDIRLEHGFLVRLTREPLLLKVKRDEMK